MKLYCATTNQGKLREFRLALERFSGNWIEPAPLAEMDKIPVCEEHGYTFEENAIEKALYYSRYAPGLLMAEDSGLEVDALNGEPGVRSARFAGTGKDEDNNRLLLEKLKHVDNRNARYVCVVALAEHGRLLATFRGAVAGWIAEAPRGTNGFGYDPLFIYPPYGRTFGEASPEEKLAVSHRARALAQMVNWLRQNGGSRK